MWYDLNKETEAIYVESRKQHNCDKRAYMVKDLDLSFVHPDDMHIILEGRPSNTSVRTKCPLCGNYSSHRLYSFICYSEHKVIKPLCKDCCNTHTASALECEIHDYISTICDSHCVRNVRYVISPDELDLYYPDKGIAVEINGDYWHSENLKKNEDCHYNKFKKCSDKGILLVSIFEKDWKLNNDAVKQYLIDLFNNRNNSLSFTMEGYMSNNYPAPTGVLLDNDAEVVKDYYTYKKLKVHTCGYTKILGIYSQS